jgi:DNA gyrase/topoisomerase IV subunit B
VEIQNLMAAIGLSFGGEEELRYGKIVLATDADMDGMHIRALHTNNFFHRWLNVLLEGRLYFLHTPIVRVLKGKDTHEFFTMDEYEAWYAKQTGKMEVTFLKGLGGHSTAHFKKYMFEDKYIVPLNFKDDANAPAMLNMAFGDAKEKKVWLNLE